jgi:hypothetical protein
MTAGDWRRKLARMLATDKLMREERAKRALPPPQSPNIATPQNTEEILRLEQHELAGVVDDAVALLRGGSSEQAKAALFERAGKLSESALLTAKVLIKARVDARSGKD